MRKEGVLLLWGFCLGAIALSLVHLVCSAPAAERLVVLSLLAAAVVCALERKK